MGIVVNKNVLTALWVSVQKAFQKGYASMGEKPMWQQVAMVVSSTSRENNYSWLGKFTRFREWIGERVYQALLQHNYRVVNKSFENSVSVARVDIEDDQFGTYAPLFEQMGQDSAEHPGELIFNLLKAGNSLQCFDGQFFFDTDHPVRDENGNEVSVSNWGGGGGSLWILADLSKVVKPIIFQKRRDYKLVKMDQPDDEKVFSLDEYRYGVDARCNVGFGLWQLAYGSKQTLDAANFNAAFAALRNMRADNGKPLGINPTHLIVTPNLRAQALELIKAERTANGATNINQGVVEVIDTPWFN